MHSTLQTGIYTPNMLGMDHHHPPHYHHNHHYHRAPSPARLHHNKHYNKNDPGRRAKLGSSTNVSLLAIDSAGDLNHSSKMNKMNLSTSNISKYSSNRNLDTNGGVEAGGRKKSVGGGSSRSSSIKLYYASAVNLSRNVSYGNMNEISKDGGMHKAGSMSISSNMANMTGHRKNMSLGDRINSFCDCSKPCGYMTLVLGCLLVSSSLAGFVLLYESTVCARADTCGNQLIKTSTIMALVFGIMFFFLGFVIVIYSKKDINTTVIITSAKNISKIAGVRRKHQHHQHQSEGGTAEVMSAVSIQKENSNLSQQSSRSRADKTDHLLLPTSHSNHGEQHLNLLP